MRGPVGRLRNAVVRRIAAGVVFRGAEARYRRIRADLDLPPGHPARCERWPTSRCGWWSPRAGRAPPTSPPPTAPRYRTTASSSGGFPTTNSSPAPTRSSRTAATRRHAGVGARRPDRAGGHHRGEGGDRGPNRAHGRRTAARQGLIPRRGRCVRRSVVSSPSRGLPTQRAGCRPRWPSTTPRTRPRTCSSTSPRSGFRARW